MVDFYKWFRVAQTVERLTHNGWAPDSIPGANLLIPLFLIMCDWAMRLAYALTTATKYYKQIEIVPISQQHGMPRHSLLISSFIYDFTQTLDFESKCDL